MSLDWRTAFLRQAKSDYAVYLKLLAMDNIPRCQQLHYLQMCTEKLAKGLSTQHGGAQPPASHDAFVRFIQVARFSSDIWMASPCRNNRPAFCEYMLNLLGKAAEVERLVPEASSTRPNPEYPWAANNAIVSPLDHGFAGLDPLRNAKMRKLQEFLKACFDLPELKCL